MSTPSATGQLLADRPPVQAAKITLSHLIGGIVLAVLSTLAFVQVFDWVRDKQVSVAAFDRRFPLWMHAHPIPILAKLAIGLAWLGAPLTMIGVALIGIAVGVLNRRVRGAAWTFPLAIVGGGALIQIIKLSVRRARPDLFTPLLKESGYSFPSGHSLISVVVYGLLGYFASHLVKNKAWRMTIALLTACLVVAIGLSRIYVGVHYPTDVVAGWVAGIPWLVACLGLHEVMTRRWSNAGEPVLTNPQSK